MIAHLVPVAVAGGDLLVRAPVAPMPRDHARFVPTDARLCGDGGGGLLAESHSETVRLATEVRQGDAT